MIWNEGEKTQQEMNQQGAPGDEQSENAGANKEILKSPPVTELQTSSAQLQTSENMEVHKHPHHVTHVKRWTEFLLEFAMIFLAVFLGFVAENIRENAVESHREKEYIKSMIEDLKIDTSKINGYIKRRANKITMMDSLAMLLVSADNKKEGNNIYYFARYVTVAFPLITSDGTLQQLKNSGGLRLIKKQKIVDSILSYDANVKCIQYLNERNEEIEKTFRETAGEAFDSRFFKFEYRDISKKPTDNPQLITFDRAVLNKILIAGSLRGQGIRKRYSKCLRFKFKGLTLNGIA